MSTLRIRITQEEVDTLAYNEWKEEAKVQVKYIRKFVENGRVRFEDCQEVGYVIDSFVKMSKCWDGPDEVSLYDFSSEAEQMIKEVTFSFV